MSILGKKLNKGEWAEFYVMLKLLGDGRLYTADKLLKKNYSTIFYKISYNYNNILVISILTINVTNHTKTLSQYMSRDYVKGDFIK